MSQQEWNDRATQNLYLLLSNNPYLNTRVRNFLAEHGEDFSDHDFQVFCAQIIMPGAAGADKEVKDSFFCSVNWQELSDWLRKNYVTEKV